MNFTLRKKTFIQILILSLLSGALFAQERKIEETLVTEAFFGFNLDMILEKLADKYDFQLDYDRDLFGKKPLQALIFHNLALSEALESLLTGRGVHYKFIDNSKLIIRPEGVPLEVIYDPTRHNFTLSGMVAERGTGESLPNAVVLIKGTEKGAVTNVDGFFTLLDVPSDTSTLIVSYLGFKTAEFKLNPGLLESQLILELQSISSQLDEVVITSTQERMMNVSEDISKITVSPDQLAKLPSLGEKDIFRSLQLLPGVSGTNETSSGLYVRGGTPDQNLNLLDGFTVYHVDHFYGFFSAFNANAIKDVQLYKGGFESKYGGRISSVVDLTGKTGNTQKFTGSVGISAISANAALEIPFAKNRGSIFFAGRRSYTDIIKSGLYNNIFDLFNQESEAQQNPGGFGRGGRGRFAQAEVEPAFFFHDINGKISFRPSDRDIIALSVYNGADNLDNSRDINSNNLGFGGGQNGNAGFNSNTNDLTVWGNWGTSLKWGRQWNSKWYTNSIIAYSNYFSERDLFTTTEIIRDDSVSYIKAGTVEDNNLKDITLKIDHEYLLSDVHQLEFGVQVTHNDISYNYTRNDTVNVLDRRDNGTVYALYVQDRWKPLRKLTLIPGIRTNYFDVTGQMYYEPRISGVFRLTSKIKLKGAWGKYYQFATRIIREDLSQGSRDFWLLANGENNPVSSAIHYIGGVSYENEKFLFDIEAYYKDLSGLAEYTLRFAGPRSREYDELFYQGTGYSRGIEFLAQKKAGKYTGWISYTLGQVMYDFPELSDEPYPALHDQTHEFKIVNSLSLGRWDLAATWVYATGKPYTSPVGTYEVTLLDGNIESYVSIGEKNAFRLPDYQRMDLSASYNFFLGKAKTQLGLSIFNVYDHTNIWYKNFEIIDGDLIATDVTTLGFTPNVFFNIKF
ncbi:MAG: TonB-dependent receptor [Cytophagales bacterium]|nr:TonB-dependent receptor [Cytophagales bacterium]